jgi:cell division septal protein FtsQ
MSRRVSDQEMRKLYSVLRRVFNESQGFSHEVKKEPTTETVVRKKKWKVAAWVFAALCVCYLLYWLARKDPKRPAKRSAG